MNRQAYRHLTLAAALAGTLGHSSFHFDKEGTAAAPPADPFTRMREEFSRLHDEAGKLIETAATENRELSDEEKKANENRFGRMKQIQSVIEERTRFAALALSGDPSAGGTVQKPAEAPGREEFDKSEGRSVQVSDKIDRAEFSRALNQWAATGEMPRKFATITTATSSGALLPKSIALPSVPSAMNVFREGLAIYGLQPVITTTTEALTVPVLSTSAGGLVAENASSETENAPSLSGSIVLNVGTYQSGSAYFSNLQLNATGFDLVTYINQDLMYAKELGLESAAIAAIIADAGITQTVATATTSGFTYDNLVDLNRKLPKRYDRLKVILLGSAAFSAAEKLVGDDGHPVLIKDPQNESLLRFNGTPVLRSDYLEAFGASKVVGIVASFMGFKLRDAGDLNLARYTQVPAKPSQTGFNLFGYHGYGYDPAAMATLKTPAS